jgi:hypothetical protein
MATTPKSVSEKGSWLDHFTALGAAMIGGLLAITAGLIALVTIALSAIFSISEAGSIASISTGAFGVIGTIVGAYFGVKVGTDTTRRALDSTDKSLGVAEQAMAGQRFEAAKAQAFAGHIDPNQMGPAIAHAIALATRSERLAPANVGPPVITGTFEEGQKFEAHAGVWTGNPAPTLTYQWQLYDPETNSWSDISGATSETYTPGPGDVGKTVRLVVTATNSAGLASASSEPVVVQAAGTVTTG